MCGAHLPTFPRSFSRSQRDHRPHPAQDRGHARPRRRVDPPGVAGAPSRRKKKPTRTPSGDCRRHLPTLHAPLLPLQAEAYADPSFNDTHGIFWSSQPSPEASCSHPPPGKATSSGSRISLLPRIGSSPLVPPAGRLLHGNVHGGAQDAHAVEGDPRDRREQQRAAQVRLRPFVCVRFCRHRCAWHLRRCALRRASRTDAPPACDLRRLRLCLTPAWCFPYAAGTSGSASSGAGRT